MEADTARSGLIFAHPLGCPPGAPALACDDAETRLRGAWRTARPLPCVSRARRRGPNPVAMGRRVAGPPPTRPLLTAFAPAAAHKRALLRPPHTARACRAARRSARLLAL